MHALLAMMLSASPTLAESEPTYQAPADHTEAWRDHLQASRHLQRDRLLEYAAAAVYPLNDEQPGMVNIFVDDEGRRCAMADLIWRSGEEALVQQTAQSNNAIRLGDVTDGPLTDWILTSGLTQEEVAFIQEPDFFIDTELPDPILQQVTQSEQARLTAHFLAAAAQLDAYNDQSIDVALDRLGDQLLSPPPQPAVASTQWGWLR